MTDASGGPGTAQITEVLGRAARGESGAADELIGLVYQDLRRMARARLGKQHAVSVEPTTLVHEAWMRIGGGAWNGRSHFFAAAAVAMRNVLVDHARHRNRVKRGGGMEQHELVTAFLGADGGVEPIDILALDEALTRLEQEFGRPAEVVVLRFFSGASMEEIAEALAVNVRTIERDWSFARAWLRRELAGSP